MSIRVCSTHTQHKESGTVQYNAQIRHRHICKVSISRHNSTRYYMWVCVLVYCVCVGGGEGEAQRNHYKVK